MKRVSYALGIHFV